MKNITKIITTLFCLTALSACQKNSIDDKTIVVGATLEPHAKILKKAKSYIKDHGYTLKIKEFTDYQQLNPSLNDGSLDANFFQHRPFLIEYNEKNNTSLVDVLDVHFEPLSLYRGKSSTNQIKSKDEIAIPIDPSNRARALLLLAANDIIEIDNDKGLNVTLLDVTNKKGLTLLELAAEQLPISLKDVDFAVIPGNYALSAKISSDKIVFSEDREAEAATLYTNVIVVKEENKDTEVIKLLIEALNRKEISDFILNEYDNRVIPQLLKE